MKQTAINQFIEKTGLALQTNVKTAPLVSFKLGGEAGLFYQPNAIEELIILVKVAYNLQLPMVILGGGNNIIFSDHGFDGLVIAMAALNHLEVMNESSVHIEAGCSIKALTDLTLNQQLTGFEWASGLPGTVGGGVFMNAKCYGGCFSDSVQLVKAIDPAGNLCILSNSDCCFDYKQSIFQKEPLVIASIVLQLEKGDAQHIQEESQKNMQDRINKHQFDFPSAGCAFKNAYAINQPAGKLIEDCGLKGTSIGGVKIYNHHANFIINADHGTTADVIALMTLVQNKVEEKFQFRLEPELRII